MNRRRKFARLMLLLGVLFGLPKEPEAAPSTLRVRVLSLMSSDTATITGTSLRVKGEGEQDFSSVPEIRVRARGKELEVSSDENTRQASVVTLAVPPGSLMSVRIRETERRFGARLQVTARNGRLFFLQELPVESYVAGVLASEMPADFPFEAKKAQAVLIRSYAISHRGRHAAEGYDFCDTTHCQAYAGQSSNSEENAAESTRGRILSFRGAAIAALYHSTCGGHTSPNQKVFGGQPLPYLQGVDDQSYCSASSHYEWQSTLSREDLGLALGFPVTTLRAEERESGGRWFVLSIDGRSMKVMDFLSEVGQRSGWNRLKSNWFEVKESDASLQFTGRGLGHGVGLCQWGARGMAELGKKYPEILRHYFPKTRLERR